ncbi:TPA: hypothetical protein NHP29_000199 [Pseudomonas aeruginosa]|nr:hypothetical protein [Pseudomonas aeruginosa]
MKYLTGETVELGDLVLIESGKTLGVVYAIIETPEDALNWGLGEAGISIEAEPFGLVFWPQSETEDPVRFISRKEIS